MRVVVISATGNVGTSVLESLSGEPSGDSGCRRKGVNDVVSTSK